MKATLLMLCSALMLPAHAGPYAPAAGLSGSTAIASGDPRFVAWATGYSDFSPGLTDNSDAGSPLVSWGVPADAFGPADAGVDSLPVVSLGDRGSITLTFAKPIANRAGPDFAVFENSITDTFLELAHVLVSSDGLHFVRFPSVSLTQTSTQISSFGSLDPTNLNNLAGKYRRGFGVPFDLSELPFDSNLDVQSITHVRILDVGGSINPSFGSQDSLGNIINDPFTTAFETGGFDLDAIGVINEAIPVPEPSSIIVLGALVLATARRRSRPAAA